MPREPGDGFKKETIFEVWGDILENAAGDGPAVINAICARLEESYLADYFNCREEYTRRDRRPFLILRWENFEAHIDARPFGKHLDVYGILSIRRGLLDNPDPMARIANLEGWERRDLQIFQTILKNAMEEALESLDEGRL